jgi:hypothetical protein
MDSSGIVTIYREGIFTLEEAGELLPVIRRLTKYHSKKVDALISRLETEYPQGQGGSALEEEINSLINSWHDKIKKLGAVSKGLWLVDFDSGDGHFCWKYPEEEIKYWHAYNDGFSNRRPVEYWIRERLRISEGNYSLQID